MDADIRAEVGNLGYHVINIGRQVSSKRSDLESLKFLSHCLSTAKEVLDMHLEQQEARTEDFRRAFEMAS